MAMVLQALCAVKEEEMKPAFNLFATGNRGKVPGKQGEHAAIDVENFRLLVPLLCEGLSDEEVVALFRKADADDSGLRL